MDIAAIQQKYSFGKLDIKLNHFKNGTPYVAFLPKQSGDLDFAMLQSKIFGFDLLQSNQISSFNTGINAVRQTAEAIACEVYITFNQTFTGNSEDKDNKKHELLTQYFYTSSPHLEQHILDNYFPNTGGVYIDTSVYDGLQKCPTLFFEEMYGWSGINVEKNYFDLLYKNRKQPSSVNVFGQLVGPEDADGETKLTYKMLCEAYKIPKVDWLNIREVGKHLMSVIDGIEGAEVLPTIIVFDYLVRPGTLNKVSKKLNKMGYEKDSIFFNYVVYKKV